MLQDVGNPQDGLAVDRIRGAGTAQNTPPPSTCRENPVTAITTTFTLLEGNITAHDAP